MKTQKQPCRIYNSATTPATRAPAPAMFSPAKAVGAAFGDTVIGPLALEVGLLTAFVMDAPAPEVTAGLPLALAAGVEAPCSTQRAVVASCTPWGAQRSAANLIASGGRTELVSTRGSNACEVYLILGGREKTEDVCSEDEQIFVRADLLSWSTWSQALETQQERSLTRLVLEQMHLTSSGLQSPRFTPRHDCCVVTVVC